MLSDETLAAIERFKFAQSARWKAENEGRSRNAHAHEEGRAAVVAVNSLIMDILRQDLENDLALPAEREINNKTTRREPDGCKERGNDLAVDFDGD